MAKLVVVAGATGKLGRLVVESLLSQTQVEHVTVRALVRDPQKPEAQALAKLGAQLHAIDVGRASDAERRAAVAGAFAVVSTLQGGPDVIVDAQLALLRAAKAEGARRFIPSDYSYDIFTLPEGINLNSDWRRTLALRADAEVTDRFEVVHVLQGIFADKFVLGFLGMFDGTTVRYWGDGTTPIDWTTWEDTAKFTAAAALDDRPVPRKLSVSGDRMDAVTFAKTLSAQGRAVSTERLGSLEDLAAEVRRRFEASPQDVYAWLPLMYARGVFGGQAVLGPSENARYPHIRPETVAQAAARGAV
jgi:nucleoside-diphosphate-sugar epimerase